LWGWKLHDLKYSNCMMRRQESQPIAWRSRTTIQRYIHEPIFSPYPPFELSCQTSLRLKYSHFLVRPRAFGPTATFTENRIEIIDTETGVRVQSPKIKTSASEEETGVGRDPTLILKPETGSFFFRTIFTPEVTWCEHPFSISSLSPNRSYTARYRDHGMTKWMAGLQPVPQDNSSDIIGPSDP